VTGLWIKVYELHIHNSPSTEPYFTIPRKCLKSKHDDSSGKEYLSILLPSSNSSFQNPTDDAECSFLIRTLVDCHTYNVEAVPDYQFLREIPIRNDITIPPTVGLLNMLTCLHAKKQLFMYFLLDGNYDSIEILHECIRTARVVDRKLGG